MRWLGMVLDLWGGDLLALGPTIFLTVVSRVWRASRRSRRRLGFWGHDEQLLVWGVVVSDDGRVRAYPRTEAPWAAAQLGPIRVTVRRRLGRRASVERDRLAYHHAVHGWTLYEGDVPVAGLRPAAEGSKR